MTTTKELIDEGTMLYNKGDVEGFCALCSDDIVLTTHARNVQRLPVRRDNDRASLRGR
jgi:hypothetical protein